MNNLEWPMFFILSDILWKVQKSHVANREGKFNILFNKFIYEDLCVLWSIKLCIWVFLGWKRFNISLCSHNRFGSHKDTSDKCQHQDVNQTIYYGIILEENTNNHHEDDANVNNHYEDDENVNNHYEDDENVNNHHEDDENVNNHHEDDENVNNQYEDAANVNNHYEDAANVNNHHEDDENVNNHHEDDENVNNHYEDDENVNNHYEDDENVNNHYEDAANVNEHYEDAANVNEHYKDKHTSAMSQNTPSVVTGKQDEYTMPHNIPKIDNVSQIYTKHNKPGQKWYGEETDIVENDIYGVEEVSGGETVIVENDIYGVEEVSGGETVIVENDIYGADIVWETETEFCLLNIPLKYFKNYEFYLFYSKLLY